MTINNGISLITVSLFLSPRIPYP